MRALRPGALVISALQVVALAYLRRDVVSRVPFWSMATASFPDLERRASGLGVGLPSPMDALPGAGSVPGATIPSFGVVLDGDHSEALRAHQPPVIVRVREQKTFVDLRTVLPDDDAVVAGAIASLVAR
jgi:L-seryl-tRNA(Ser) seleniumtransferase